jgi:hypothetical protein
MTVCGWFRLTGLCGAVGLGNRVEMGGRTAIRTLYFAAGLALLPPACRCVDVPPLLRGLIITAVRACPLDLRQPVHERLVGVLLDHLAASPVAASRAPVARRPAGPPSSRCAAR